MLIFPVTEAQGRGPEAMGVTGSPVVTSQEPLQRPMRNSGCIQRGKMDLSFQAANKAQHPSSLVNHSEGKSTAGPAVFPCRLEGWQQSGLDVLAFILAKLLAGTGCPPSSPSRLHQQEASAYAEFPLPLQRDACC